MTPTVDGIVKFYNSIPFPLIACLAGWAVSVGITQPVKFMLPLNWYPRTREMIAKATAFFSGFLTVLLMLPGTMGAVLAVLVGLWSPAAYSALSKWLAPRYPFLADLLSADVRGVAKGDIRENRPVPPPTEANDQ